MNPVTSPRCLLPILILLLVAIVRAHGAGGPALPFNADLPAPRLLPGQSGPKRPGAES